MYTDTIDYLANLAASRVAYLKGNPVGFFIGSMMVGIFASLFSLLSGA